MNLTNDDITNKNIQSLIKTYKDGDINEYELYRDIKGMKQDYNMMIHEIQTGSIKRMSNDNDDIYIYISYPIGNRIWII